MAGRGGNEAAAAEVGLGNFPDDIKRAGEKLLDCFMNPDMGVISVWGFEGVGRWSIAKYAARKSNDSHLFDVHILVQLWGNNFSLRKAQKEIAWKLGMTTSMDDDDDDEESIDTKLATEICKSLIGRKFLLMLGDVPEDIYFNLIGDPKLRKVLINDSKIVLVGTKELQSDMAIKLDGLSMDMLHHEAADIARSPSIRGHFAPDAVLDCFLYMLLFGWVKVDFLTWHWRAVEFIITEEGEEEYLMMLDKVEALLTELQVRSMVDRERGTVSNKDKFSVPKLIDEKASALVKWSKRSASTRGRFWLEEGSLPKEEDEVEDIQFMNVYNIREPLLLPPKCPKLSALFLSCDDNDIRFRVSDNFFEQIQGLRVLWLEELGNESLPKSTSCLHNLRFLLLNTCPHLWSLLSSFQIPDKLECIDLRNAVDTSPPIPDNVFQHMNNLRNLSLQNMHFTSLPSSISMLKNLWHLMLFNFKNLIRIPDDFFGHLKQLRILDLGENPMLESLPSSLFELVNLKKLILSGCSSLNMGLLPHLQNLSALEELDLRNCSSLQDLRDITSPSLGDILPNLHKLDISEIESVQRLSLKGCQSLDFVSLFDLKSLEKLDLSGTKLRTLPEGISSAYHLRHLDMLHMKQIRKINWDEISTELEELNFSQCGTWETLNVNEQLGERGGARIRLRNSKLLQSFSPSSKLWDSKCFSQFHIYIAPCQEDEQERGKSIHLQRKQFTYDNIHSKIRTSDLPDPGSNFDMCLEIRGGRTSPSDIHGVLSHAELLTLRDNAAIQRLSELGDVDKMKELKECRIKGCEQMEIFFEGDNASSDCLSQLEKIWMYNLARLRCVCEGTYTSGSFALLKHIHLDYCLRLVTVFSSSVFLQSLETLEIKNCSKLKAVFEGDTAAEGSLQRLRTVCLWELPRLESICHGMYLSALKKLQVRGCGILKKLPLRAGDIAAASTSTGGGRVEVEGESEWWDRLKWEDERIQHLINFKDPRPFTQRR